MALWNIDRYLKIVEWARLKHTVGGFLVLHRGPVPSTYSIIEDMAAQKYLGTKPKYPGYNLSNCYDPKTNIINENSKLNKAIIDMILFGTGAVNIEYINPENIQLSGSEVLDRANKQAEELGRTYSKLQSTLLTPLIKRQLNLIEGLNLKDKKDN